ncbi:MBL fold metallo-hydrolase [Streptosporangium sp. NPDC023963]|uniref:MBL fold metallo-hydrolase n=1 Tax=Streptosporangium sp. NPDC023963 TaxID=3155608 RepID=UPI00341BC926
MDTQTWEIGTARITTVPEIDATSIISSILPDATVESLGAFPWLAPDYVDEQGQLKGLVQSFLIEADNKVILIDSCVGNGKHRQEMAEWSGIQTDFLGTLSRLGFDREAVDIVVCTHLHFDHVGWNTVREGDDWVPTFPNASYLFFRGEYEYWAGHPEAEIADDHAGFADSVQPIVDAGLATLVEADHEVSASVRLLPTFGHTPGHVSVEVHSGSDRAVITGDAMHHPCQIAAPEWGTLSDTRPDEARASRRELLEALSGSPTLLIGSHFPVPSAGKVITDGDGFQLIHVR